MNYELFMAEAIAEARRGGEEGEVPVGAVAVLDDAMIARDHDRMLLTEDPTAHAVLLTVQAAARKLGRAPQRRDHLHHPRAVRHVRRGAPRDARAGPRVRRPRRARRRGIVTDLARHPAMQHRCR